MCGIAGEFRFDGKPVSEKRLGVMMSAVEMRGADGRSAYRDSREMVGLVHSRLSVIDLSMGAQPMVAKAEGAWGKMVVVFNGEIYNHRLLRHALTQRGHKFRTDHSDTEVLLHGYREWGEGLAGMLEGMFAFAVWDEGKQELYLARDRSGKKPLFVMQGQSKFNFASVLPALKKVAGQVEIDGEAALNYLRYGYTFRQSMMKGVEELHPASWMKIDATGKVERQIYWSLPSVGYHEKTKGMEASAEEMLEQAVGMRLESDVALGCFLSGGLDSSVIAAIAQQKMQAAGASMLRTFCVRMPSSHYDESEYALEVAKHLGTNHTTLECRQSEVIDDLYCLMDSYGEPTADSSILPTYWLCRETRSFVKVALSGDGGDELFGGYDRYRAMKLLGRYRWGLYMLPRFLFGGSNPKAKRVRLERLIRAARAGGNAARQYHDMVQIFREHEIAELGIAGVSSEVNARMKGAVPEWESEVGRVNAAMRWDYGHYLPFETLRKMDRASMAVSLEVRCPLMDRKLTEMLMHAPAKSLMVGGKQKGMLRQIAKRYLPAKIVGRKKMGFGLPIGEWFRGPMKDDLLDHLYGRDLAGMGLERDVMEDYVQEHMEKKADHTHKLFAMLQLAIWLKWMRE